MTQKHKALMRMWLGHLVAMVVIAVALSKHVSVLDAVAITVAYGHLLAAIRLKTTLEDWA